MNILRKTLSASLSLLIAILSPGLTAAVAAAAETDGAKIHLGASGTFKEVPKDFRFMPPSAVQAVKTFQTSKGPENTPAAREASAPAPELGAKGFAADPAAGPLNLWGPGDFQKAKKISEGGALDASAARELWNHVWTRSRTQASAEPVRRPNAEAGEKSPLAPPKPRSTGKGGLLGLAAVPLASPVPVTIPAWLNSLWQHYGSVIKVVGIGAASFLASGILESVADTIVERLGGDVVARAKAQRIARYAVVAAGSVLALHTLGLAAPLAAAALTGLKTAAIVAAPYAKLASVMSAAYLLDRVMNELVDMAERYDGRPGSLKGQRRAFSFLIWTGIGALGLNYSGLAAPAFKLVAANLPKIKAAAYLAGAYGAHKLAQKIVDKIAKSLGWQDKTKDVAQIVVNTGIALTGVTLGLQSIGFAADAILKLYNGVFIGGLALQVSEATEDHIEGAEVLPDNPFNVGDRIEFDGRIYFVKDIKLGDVTLVEEGLPNSPFPMTYTQLSEKIITVFKSYDVKRGSRFALAARGAPAEATLASRFVKAAATIAVVSLLSAAAPVMTLSIPSSLLAMALPYLKGGMILYATRAAEQWLSALVLDQAQKRGWDRRLTLVARLLAQAGTYLVGGKLAVHAVGVPWTTLKSELGWTAGAVGVGSVTVINRLRKTLWTHFKFRRTVSVGGTIRTGGYFPITGKVLGTLWHYVVVERDANSHVLLPYTYLNSVAYDPIAPADLEAAKSNPPGTQQK